MHTSMNIISISGDIVQSTSVASDVGTSIIEEDQSQDFDLNDRYLTDVLSQCESSEIALEHHLLNKPKVLTITYDNIDGNSKSSDFVVGDESENSYHWCSSVIFEDVVSANDLSDTRIQPCILDVPPDVRMSVTTDESEHLLHSYTLYVMHLVQTQWPNLFPKMQTTANIPHQYSKQFEQGVNCWVGPLVFETESSIDGISKVITELIDQVCPKSVDNGGTESPIHPTVFSGDNKTEKMARSAKLALVENGSMRDRLGNHSNYFNSF